MRVVFVVNVIRTARVVRGIAPCGARGMLGLRGFVFESARVIRWDTEPWTLELGT